MLTGTKKLSIGKKILFSAIVVILFFILMDRILKVYDKYLQKKSNLEDNKIVLHMLTSQQLDDYKKATDLKLVPYIGFRQAPNFHSKTININSFGYRGREIKKEKDLGVYRIIVVGGSGAMGYGSSDDDHAFPQALETLLNAKYKAIRFEVINAGLASGISMQELVLISTELLDLKPDLVVVFDGFNDIVGSVINDRRPNYPWRFNTIEKVLDISPTKVFINHKLRKFRLTKIIMNMMEEAKRKKDQTALEANWPAVTAYLSNLRKINNILKGLSVKTVFIMQPAIYFKKNLSADEKEILKKEPGELGSIVKPMFLKAVNKLEMEGARSEDFLFHNFLNAFDECNQAIFFDSVHFGDKGQEIVAGKISEIIGSILARANS